MSENELLYYHKLSEEKQVEYFHDIWVLKESYLKYTGDGLINKLGSISIGHKKQEYFLESITLSQHAFFNLKDKQTLPGYKLASCTGVPIKEFGIRKLEKTSFILSFLHKQNTLIVG